MKKYIVPQIKYFVIGSADRVLAMSEEAGEGEFVSWEDGIKIR